MPEALYLDTSVVLRAVLESGLTPGAEKQIAAATVLVTSRLSLVESARALLRIRQSSTLSELRLDEAESALEAVWDRCDLWELTPSICESAGRLAPRKLLRTLDALHLATFLAARRRIPELTLLSADARLQEAVGGR